MYCISETQIDFILDDIRARGIGMESLQQNLLDHICCVIEHDLDDDGDFESFYQKTVSGFYKSELREIEEETIYLLTNKHFYVMKKIMIVSGGLSAAILSLGILLKFLHLPGAAVFILIGIVILSFVFLPLLFTLKVKEKQQMSDKIIAAIGTFSGMVISMGILFKIMHWPFANILCITALFIMLFGFLPVYFFSGIRNPQTKVNTIVSSVLLLAGCLLILTLIRSPEVSRMQYVADTGNFLRNEQIFQTEKRQLAELVKTDTVNSGLLSGSEEINRLCDELKTFLVQKETGQKTIDPDFESKEALLEGTQVRDYFSGSPEAQQKLSTLRNEIESYNAANSKLAHLKQLPLEEAVFGTRLRSRVSDALNTFTQIQMIVLQNQRDIIAMK